VKVADAYYVLSDPKRRKEYDDLYGSRSQRPSGGFSRSGPSAGASSGFPGGAFPGGFASGAAADDEEYDESSQHEASGNFFRTFASMFGGGGKTSEKAEEEDPLHGGRPDANGVFGDVFEDMYVLRLFFISFSSSADSLGKACTRGSECPALLELRRWRCRRRNRVYRREHSRRRSGRSVPYL
jgi:curved DNA-binding protein CbpA